jgi:hypothetical protein
VPGAFDVAGAHGVGFGGAGLDLGLDGEGDLEGQRGEGLEQQLADGGVGGGAGDGLAARPGVVDALAHALVVRDLGAAAGVVADRHPPPALSADGQALQQRGAFPGRAGGPVGAAGGGVAEQDLLVSLVLFPGDVSGVGAGDQRGPLVPRQRLEAVLAVGAGGAAAAAVDERAGIPGIMQGAQHPPVGQRHPGQFALAWPGADPHRERQLLISEGGHHGAGRAGAREDREQVAERLLHPGIGVEHDVPGDVVGQPDRQARPQLAAAGRRQLPAAQPGPDEMQFILADLPFHPED